jgi:hypothetical protein
MHEQDKLGEAQYFLDRLPQLPEPNSFRYELSAFLSAARSALQYARKEAKTKPNGLTWYDAHSVKTLIKFFKVKRNISIHEHPVRPVTSANVAITGGVSASANVAITGGVSASASNPPPPPSPPVVAYSYTFTDWSGPEDVVTLCRLYLAEVQSVVSNGVAQGHLTP